MTEIAFIGLGNMGSGMCANLVAAGNKVCAFDLNRGAVATMKEIGATGANSLSDAVHEADVIVTMLPAGEHVLSVYFGPDGIASQLKSGALLIDCSTISVNDARELAGKANASGLDIVDAPVSGGVAAAKAGTLTFMVGGTKEAFARARPILDDMGKNVFYAGGTGNGQAAKIANNMLLAISMIGTCEAFNLAERLGLDAQTFFNISSNASGQCWSMTSYCPAPGPVPEAPSNRDYEPGFTAAMMLKDLVLAGEAATMTGAETALGDHARDIYKSLNDFGLSETDFSGIMKLLKSKP